MNLNWISKLIVLLLLIVTYFSFNFKSFGLMLLGGALIFILLSIRFKKYANYFLPIISSLFLLTIFEYLIPLLDSSSTKTVYDLDSDYYNNRVDGFGFIPNPGIHTSRKMTVDGEEIYNVSYTIGSDGYRQSPSAKDTNVYLYGGSFVFGEGLDDNETLVHYLWEDYNIAVKSVGVHGYGLHQALFNIQNGVSAKDGVNILLTAPWHALRSACKPSYAAGTPKYIINSNEYVELSGVCAVGDIVSRVLKRSNIFSLIQKNIVNKNVMTDEDMDLYFAIIKTIKNETLKNNSKLMIAYIKASNEILENTTWTNDLIVKEISKLSDIFIDVSLSDKIENLESKYYIHALDKHPSAIANFTRAGLISSKLK